jgi:hypothetical protein
VCPVYFFFLALAGGAVSSSAKAACGTEAALEFELVPFSTTGFLAAGSKLELPAAGVLADAALAGGVITTLVGAVTGLLVVLFVFAGELPHAAERHAATNRDRAIYDRIISFLF